MVNAVVEQRTDSKNKKVINFMHGVSFEISPIDTLKMVTASSIFGEPQYYRTGEFAEAGLDKITDGKYTVDHLVKDLNIIDSKYIGMKTSNMMEKIIDEALDYDFEATIRWALTLRKDYYMRLNPQIIMVRASLHPNRVKFNENNPEVFKNINVEVMSRADEPSSQLTYWLFRNKKFAKIPSILKRSWAKRIEAMSRYEMYKYHNKGLGLIDTVRACHAHSDLVDELMRTGTIKVEEDENTWETYISTHGSNSESWNWVIDNLFTKEVGVVGKQT